MDDAMKKKLAAATFKNLCQALDNNDWHYKKDEENLSIECGARGDDLPIELIIRVDADRQLLRILSPMAFKMPEDKRVEGAIATCAASYAMADGTFDYDLSDGQIVFRMAHPFHDSVIGTAAVGYMIDCTCAMVDKYNDKFLALSKGLIDIGDFIKKEQ